MPPARCGSNLMSLKGWNSPTHSFQKVGGQLPILSTQLQHAPVSTVFMQYIKYHTKYCCAKYYKMRRSVLKWNNFHIFLKFLFQNVLNKRPSFLLDSSSFLRDKLGGLDLKLRKWHPHESGWQIGQNEMTSKFQMWTAESCWGPSINNVITFSAIFDPPPPTIINYHYSYTPSPNITS